MYPDVKYAHILFAAMSIGLFVLRGGSAILASKPLAHRVWKILPHIVDTMLLALGVWLAAMLRINPLHVTWLGVKLLCVLGYIVLGVLAFRLKRPRWLRIMLFFTAVLLFAFIISIALLHDPAGVFSLMGN
ncbi:MAG TPA: SirB2 family protein [Gammaproteobacteria bacterium]|nr:SirB2 family protein [Gammaproteobacteria bacterium]